MKLFNGLLLATIIIFSTILSSCNSDSDDGGYITAMLSFATLTVNNDMGCTFTTQEKDDSELVTFTSTTSLNKNEYTIGNRYLIAYNNESGERYKSGPISLHTIYGISNGKAEDRDKSVINNLATNMLRASMVYREGIYINVEATAPYMSGYVKVFNIYVDDATTGNDYPDAYLVYEPYNINTNEYTFCGSFDISPVWNLPTCKGLHLHYYDRNGDAKTDIFVKSVSLTPSI